MIAILFYGCKHENDVSDDIYVDVNGIKLLLPEDWSISNSSLPEAFTMSSNYTKTREQRSEVKLKYFKLKERSVADKWKEDYANNLIKIYPDMLNHKVEEDKIIFSSAVSGEPRDYELIINTVSDYGYIFSFSCHPNDYQVEKRIFHKIQKEL
jgi:hypothetical protein